MSRLTTGGHGEFLGMSSFCLETSSWRRRRRAVGSCTPRRRTNTASPYQRRRPQSSPPPLPSSAPRQASLFPTAHTPTPMLCRSNYWWATRVPWRRNWRIMSSMRGRSSMRSSFDPNLAAATSLEINMEPSNFNSGVPFNCSTKCPSRVVDIMASVAFDEETIVDEGPVFDEYFFDGHDLQGISLGQLVECGESLLAHALEPHAVLDIDDKQAHDEQLKWNPMMLNEAAHEEFGEIPCELECKWNPMMLNEAAREEFGEIPCELECAKDMMLDHDAHNSLLQQIALGKGYLDGIELWLRITKEQVHLMDPTLDHVLLVPGIVGSVLEPVDDAGNKERVRVRILLAEHDSTSYRVSHGCLLAEDVEGDARVILVPSKQGTGLQVCVGNISESGDNRSANQGDMVVLTGGGSYGQSGIYMLANFSLRIWDPGGFHNSLVSVQQWKRGGFNLTY